VRRIHARSAAWRIHSQRVNLAAARLRAGQIDDAYRELRDVSHDALAVNDIDLTIGLIELFAILWAELGDVSKKRPALWHL
jgi:hypothetical protein